MILINYLMFREIIPEKLLLKISYFWPFFANFLVLDRKLIWMALFWAVTLNFWVAPSWLKTYFESIFSLFLDLTCLDWFSELRILCIYIYSWKCLLHWPVHSIACQSLGTGSCIRPRENFKVGFLKHHF